MCQLIGGNPERSYKAINIKSQFKGPINDYIASILYDWKSTSADNIVKLGSWLKELGLTWKIDTAQMGDGRLKILVHRLPKKGKNESDDMVDISDVGYGISQVLPVLIALLIAKKNQLVYIEQPEVHLHPKAQYLMAKYIVESSKRGVRVVLETHSAMILLCIQTLVAKKCLRLIRLHFTGFLRDEDGYTDIKSVKLDDTVYMANGR